MILSPLRQAPLSVRLALLIGSLTAAVIAIVFIVLSFGTRARTREMLAAELDAHQRTLVDLQRQSLQQILVTSALLGESPSLRAAMSTYREESRRGTALRSQLVATIRSSLGTLTENLSQPLLIVTDDQGKVLWAADRTGPAPESGTDLSTLVAVRSALDSGDAAVESRFAIVRVHGDLFQIGAVPVIQGGFPIGTLLLGDPLDSTAVRRLKQTLGSDVVIRVDTTILVSSTNDPAVLAGLPVGDGESVLAASLPMGRDELGRRVTLDLVRSVSAAAAPLQSALTRSFLLYGLLAVGLSTVVAGIGARSVLHSFRDFVGFMGAVAQSRDYSRRFVDSRPTSEMRTLTDAYSQLIASLSESHAQLAERGAELTQANAELRQEVEERERAQRTLRERDEQLRQSQKLEAVGTLAGGVAHDFNNLLTVIHSYTELLMSSVEKDNPMHADLEQVRQAAARAGRLTSQLLAFSRKQVMQPRVMDLGTIVSSVEKMLRRLIGEHIEFRTTTVPQLPRVKADPGQIEQVIVNLAVNARDAMPKGGKLVISTGTASIIKADPQAHGATPPGEWVTLSVSDTGTGMEEPVMRRMFEPFFTTKPVGHGTGLGLSMVYGIVSQSGGHIAVDSELGKGTTFRVYLPAIEALEDETASGGDGATSVRGTETVLLVEDEEMVRTLSERTLRAQGYTVLSAPHGADALALLERHNGPIQLLLTDVIMPQMSGKDLADAVVRRHPAVRVLFMSGYTEDLIAHHGMLENGVSLLQKPFTPSMMARRVREVLDAPPR